MRKVTFLLVLLALSASSRAAADAPLVVAFGDSITRGVHMPETQTYPHLLGELLPDARVVNRGVPGNTIAQGMARLERDVLALKPAFVLISFGVNDSVMTAPNRPRVPPAQYEKLLIRMIDRIRAAGAKPIVATQTPIVAEVYYTRHPKAYYAAVGGVRAFLARYNDIIRRVAQAKSVPLVDVAKVFEGKEAQWIRPAPDGVHPNARGYEAIARAFAKVLRAQPELKGARVGRIKHPAPKPATADEFDSFEGWSLGRGLQARCADGKLILRAGKTYGWARKTFYLDPSRFNLLAVKIDRTTGIYNIQVAAGGERRVFRRAANAGAFRRSHGLRAKGPTAATLIINLAANVEAEFDYVRFEAGARRKHALLLPVPPPRAPGRSETERFWYLANVRVAFAIDKRTGALAAGWNQLTRERCIDLSLDRYEIERRADRVKTTEADDRVAAAQWLDRGDALALRVRCTNPQLPGVRLTKLYSLGRGANLLSKRLGVVADRDIEGFFKHTSVVRLTPAFRKGGYYNRPERHPQDYPYIYADEIVEDLPARMWAGIADYHLVTFVNLGRGYGVGHYRYRVNDRYAHPLTCAAYEPSLYYTYDGWRMGDFADRLLPGREVSGEIHYTIFQGDQVAFHRQYMRLPEFGARNRYQPPAWVRDVKTVMLGSMLNSPKELARRMALIDEGYVVFLMWSLFDTSDYPTEGVWSPRHGDRPESQMRISADWVRQRFAAYHAGSPRIKLAPYTWFWSVSPKSRFAKDHPEWLTYGRDGKPVVDYIKFWWKRMTPECRRFCLAQCDRLLRAFDFDVFYLDGGQGGSTMFDWRTTTCTQDYDWEDFHKGLRLLVRKHGPDKAAFYNGANGLYCLHNDMGFFEGFIKTRDWRALSDRLFLVKLYQRGDIWTAPLYYRNDNQQDYVNYLYALALKPAIAPVPSVVPVLTAAYELRDARLVDADVRPCWWKQKTEIECYTLRQRDAGLVSVLNHAGRPADATVEFDIAPLGLRPGEPAFVYELRPWPVSETFKNAAGEAYARAAYAKQAWAVSNVVALRPARTFGVAPKRISHRVSARPNVTMLLLVTHSPALVYSVGGRVSNFALPSLRGTTVSGKRLPTRSRCELVVDAAEESEILCWAPTKWGALAATVDAQPAAFSVVFLAGKRLVLLRVPRGKHRVVVAGDGREPKVQLVRASVTPSKPCVAGQTTTLTIEAVTRGRPASAQWTVNLLKNDTLVARRRARGIVDGDKLRVTARFDIPKLARGGRYDVQIAGDSVRPNAAFPNLTVGRLDVDVSARKPFERRSSAQRCVRRVDERTSTVAGLKILRSLEIDCEHNSEDAARADRATLTLWAANGHEKRWGYGYAGFEIEGLRRALLHVRVTPCELNVPFRKGAFVGAVADYHTAAGYAKRVVFGLGSLKITPSAQSRPYWGTFGRRGAKCEAVDFSSQIAVGKDALVGIDLARYAPPGWDGRVLFAAGVDCAGTGAEIRVRIEPWRKEAFPAQAITRGEKLARPEKRRVLAKWKSVEVYDRKGGVDLATMALRVRGPGAAAILARGLRYVTLRVSGDLAGAALVVDFHERAGFTTRAVLSLSDRTVAASAVAAAFPAPQPKLNVKTADIHKEITKGLVTVRLGDFAPSGWDGLCWFALVQTQPGANTQARLTDNETFWRF